MGFLLGGYGTQRTSTGGGGITEILVGNTFYVDAVYGDDSTGTGDRFDLPFLTIEAALAAAKNGDMINIHAGTYAVSDNLLKDGVSYWCEEGVTINCSAIPFNADTTTGGVTLTTPFYFSGNAIINCTEPLIVTVTNPLAELTIELNSLDVSNISNGMVLSDGIVNLYIKKDYISAGSNFIMYDSGNLNAYIGGEVACTLADITNGNIWCKNSNWSGSAYIKAKTFRLDTTVKGVEWTYIYITKMKKGGTLQVDLDYLYDFSANTTAMVRVDSEGSTGGTVILNINEIELSNRGLFKVADANVNLFINSDIVYDCAGADISAGLAVIKISNWQTHFSVTCSSVAYLGLASTSLDSSSGGVGNPPIKLTGGLVGLVGAVLTSDSAESCLVNDGGTVKSFGSGGSGLIPSGSATPILIGEFECEGVRFQNTQNYTAGATVTVSNYISVLYINPAALVAALTIKMPAAPVNNQEVILSFGGTITVGAVITALTLSGNTGQTILGAAGITTANAGDSYTLKYQASTSIWRIL